MRVPLSWLREYVDLPAAETGRGLAARLVRAGLEVETVEPVGADLSGPLVVGRVLDVEEFTASNGKTIRFCHVHTGEEEPRGIVCGATNFAAGDLVVVALPGAVLPGGFTISARQTYGHLSDGMICSTRELGIGDDHAGILVLPPGAAGVSGAPGETAAPEVGADAMPVLGLPDEVLDIAVTPDRGYCLSMRGIAREAATAYGLSLRDPADVDMPPDGNDGDGGGAVQRAGIEDPTACDLIVLRTVEGLDPAASTPSWMSRRLHLAGMRPISLPVDVTNYVMLEMGQPLHAFDRVRLTGTVTVRRARPGERLETLDHVQRLLDPDDVLIADDSGALSLAGTMGGLHSEIDAGSRELVIEAAHFDAVATASMSRRHKVSSEASRRFERGVDPELPRRASARAVALLAKLGGARLVGSSVADARLVGSGVAVARTPLAPRAPTIEIDADLPSRVVGLGYAEGEPERLLREVGCTVEVTGTVSGPETAGVTADADAGAADGRRLRVTPPSWRPDLTDPFDLVEEVARLHGYDTIPSVLPVAPAGRGLTEAQRLHRQVGRALASVGYVEAPSYPFVGPATWDALGLPADDVRRRTERLANPLSEEEPELRTTLLPGLLRALARNVGRGQSDIALFETGLVVLPREDAPVRAPRLGVDRRPDPEQIAALDAALPHQPRHLAVVLAGDREPVGWWGSSRSGCWADAVEAARTAASAAGARLTVRRGDRAPWHPGRCAELVLAASAARTGEPAEADGGVHDGSAGGGVVVGHAGELHPRVVAAFGLPPRTCAMELDLDAVLAAGGGIVEAPQVSTYPVATQDLALVVADGVAAADVESALRAGAGDLLESLRLFDVYTGSSVGVDRRSLAYALRFRAADRTLTAEEASAARDAAVAEATRRTGAVLRGT